VSVPVENDEFVNLMHFYDITRTLSIDLYHINVLIMYSDQDRRTNQEGTIREPGEEAYGPLGNHASSCMHSASS